MFYLLVATGLVSVELPPHDVAVLNAIDFCTQVTDGGNVQANYPSEIFVNLPPSVAARSKMKTSADVPPLIQRFAQTSPSGRFGAVEFANTASQTGPVWISYSARMPLCDIAVTGQNDLAEYPANLITSLTAAGWERAGIDSNPDNAPVAVNVLRKALKESEVLQMRITKLLVGGGPDGIGLEIQMVRGTSQLRQP